MRMLTRAPRLRQAVEAFSQRMADHGIVTLTSGGEVLILVPCREGVSGACMYSAQFRTQEV